jgi:hypothetical protein
VDAAWAMFFSVSLTCCDDSQAKNFRRSANEVCEVDGLREGDV